MLTNGFSTNNEVRLMFVLFDILYREYCRARVAEMRSQQKLTDGREAPEANCDGGHANGTADRAGDNASELRLISGASSRWSRGCRNVAACMELFRPTMRYAAV